MSDFTYNVSILGKCINAKNKMASQSVLESRMVKGYRAKS